MTNFQIRLRESMRTRRMTQSEFAKLIEVSPGTLSAYLREGDGKKAPTLDTLERIAHKLGVSIGWLCGDDQTNAPMLNYADLIQQALRLTDPDMPCRFKFLVSNNEHTPFAALYTDDENIVHFFSDYERIKELLDQGTIDQEMHDAWVEKRMKDYRVMEIPYQRKYRAANKEKIAAYQRKYRAANKDNIAARQREYYAAKKAQS